MVVLCTFELCEFKLVLYRCDKISLSQIPLNPASIVSKWQTWLLPHGGAIFSQKQITAILLVELVFLKSLVFYLTHSHTEEASPYDI